MGLRDVSAATALVISCNQDCASGNHKCFCCGKHEAPEKRLQPAPMPVSTVSPRSAVAGDAAVPDSTASAASGHKEPKNKRAKVDASPVASSGDEGVALVPVALHDYHSGSKGLPEIPRFDGVVKCALRSCGKYYHYDCLQPDERCVGVYLCRVPTLLGAVFLDESL